MNALDVNISCFDRFSANPETVNLLEWLMNDGYGDTIVKLRQIQDPEQYKKQKKTLPGITPSGVFNERKETGLIQHSGLIQFDIDEKDNSDWDMAQLKDCIKHIPYAAYCSYSTSGKGLWGLIPIQYPEKHKAHFRAVRQAFKKTGVSIDRAPQNVCSFRFVSYDPDPYFNSDAMVFHNILETENCGNKYKPGKNSDKVKSCIQQIVALKLDITGEYHEWFSIGTSFLAEFGGGPGLEMFHQISKYSPKYNPDALDRQWKVWQEHDAGADIGVFFNCCRKHGITFTSKAHDHQDYKIGNNEMGYPADWDNLDS